MLPDHMVNQNAGVLNGAAPGTLEQGFPGIFDNVSSCCASPLGSGGRNMANGHCWGWIQTARLCNGKLTEELIRPHIYSGYYEELMTKPR